MNKIDNLDKAVYHLGMVGLCVAGFCWGWNWIHFGFKSDK